MATSETTVEQTANDLFSQATRMADESNEIPKAQQTPPAPLGHNRRIRVRDLQERAPQHERRHNDDREFDAALVRAADPSSWLPFPVVEIGSRLYPCDGTILLSAIFHRDPHAIVDYYIVDPDEALRIRSKDNAERARPEPMSVARRARILAAAGWTHASVAKELRVKGEEPKTDARISQLIDAAAAESSLSNLAAAISDPARIPVRFWEAVAQHMKRLRPREENEGAGDRRSVEEFHLVVNRLVTELRASETSISYTACLERLGISSATKTSTRRRHVGERHKIAGTSECVGFNLTRAGGAAISLPPALTTEQAKTVLKTVLAEVSRLLVGQAPAPDRHPQE